MKMLFTADPRAGFVRSTLAPVRRHRTPRFGFLDGAILFALLLGMAAMVVFVVA